MVISSAALAKEKKKIILGFSRMGLKPAGILS
jgi:hypothetical protein